MTDISERSMATPASTDGAARRPHSGNPIAPPATISNPRWPRLVALSLAALYLIGVGGGWASNARDGYYGITRVDSAPDRANRLSIIEVAPGSPAELAGLRPGDTILSVDGERLGEAVTPGSRGRWVTPGGAPTFQTRPLAVPPGDAPLFRRTTGDRRSGERRALQIQRAETGAIDPAGGAVLDVTLILASHLAAPGVVVALLTWHVVALVTLAVGVIVVVRRPSDVASRLLLAMASSFSLALVLLSWDNRPVPREIAFGLQLATAALLVSGPASLLHLSLAFPQRHPLLVRLGTLGPSPFGRFGGATSLIYILPLAFALSLYLGPSASWPWSNLVSIALMGLALSAFARSMLHPPNPIARVQLKWVAGPLVIGLLALILGPGFSAVSGARSELLSPTATVAAWSLFPLGLGIAIVRYRLFDVDLVLRAAMFYPLLAALLAAAYLAVVLVFGRIAASFAAPDANEDLAVSVLAALLVAAAAQPIYRRLQAGLDHLLYRERIARQRLLEEAADLADHARLEESVSFLTAHVAERLGLARAWLVLPGWVGASDGLPPATLFQFGEELLGRMRKLTEPVWLLTQDEQVAGGLHSQDPEDPAFARWYAAGARLLLPLCAAELQGNSTAGLLGIWVIGYHRSGSLPDSDDLKALNRIARQAELLLDRYRLHRLEAVESNRTERFRRYFSPQIATVIAEEGELATHRRELTVLFAELRGGEALGDALEPEELVEHLNRCLGTVTEVIFEHGGTLDKYLADGVMAFFGDPLPQSDHANRAVQAAVAIQQRLAELKQRSGVRLAPTAAGIGIATGWVTAGTIGSSNRQEYTVVGDTVTVAARLAAMAAQDEVLLTDKTRELLEGRTAVEPHGQLPIEGRRRAVSIFRISQWPISETEAVRTVSREPTVRDDSHGTEPPSDGSVRADLLARTALFASISPNELTGLAERLRLQKYPKGAQILRAHEPCSSFFLISSGTVKLTRALMTGDEAVMSILGRGEFFGELALLEGQSGDHTVIALQPTEVLVLSREVFLDSLKAYPSAVSAAITLLSARIRRLGDRLEEAYSLELPQRLARRLVELGEMHGTKTPEGTVIDLSLTQSDLAALVGASRQRVNRLLAEWQDRRLLRLGSLGKMTILRPEGFAELSFEHSDN